MKESSGAGEKWVFEDLGNVRIKWNPDIFLEKTAYALDTTPQNILEFLKEESPPVFQQIETGGSEESIRRRFCARFGKDIPAEEFYRVFNSGIEPYDFRRMKELSRKIRASGAERAVISNINAIHVRFIERRFPFVFTDIAVWRRFYSYKLGMRKDKIGAVFQMLFENLGIIPERAVLIDDTKENIEGFEKAGGRGILFKGFHQAEYELRKLGVIN